MMQEQTKWFQANQIHLSFGLNIANCRFRWALISFADDADKVVKLIF